MLSKQELQMIRESKLSWTIFEIYLTGGPDNVSGWEIQHVVIQADRKEAREIIKQYPNFDCIITMGDWFHQEHAVIFDREKKMAEEKRKVGEIWFDSKSYGSKKWKLKSPIGIVSFNTKKDALTTKMDHPGLFKDVFSDEDKLLHNANEKLLEAFKAASEFKQFVDGKQMSVNDWYRKEAQKMFSALSKLFHGDPL